MFYWGAYDLSYLLWIAPGFLLSLLASLYVKSTFAKWAEVPTARGRSGAQVAAELLARSGVVDVAVERVGGFLSDHYDPSARVLRLSPDVYDGTSVSAVGVAAHEAGHALQHATRYPLIGLRQALVGPARIGSQLSYIVIAAGIMLHLFGLAWLGVLLFAAVLLFEVVTVPVEINASRRAHQQLLALGLVDRREADGVGKVLTAAAFTYIAAVVTTALTLLYFITRLNREER